MAFTFEYTLGQQSIRVDVKQNTRKNIILRIKDDKLALSVPKGLPINQVINWLDSHQTNIQTLLTTQIKVSPVELPDYLLYLGKAVPLELTDNADIIFTPQKCCLPKLSDDKIKHLIANILYNQALIILPQYLYQQAEQLQLTVKSIKVTSVKSYWGICTADKRIRLNWRLISAPIAVIEYLCVHELCHITHPNHSQAFWDMVNQYTPHTCYAKKWLKEQQKLLYFWG